MSIDILLVVIVTIVAAPRCEYPAESVEIAQADVDDIAYHDYPLWALDHPNECPTLREVLEHVGKSHDDLFDPWDRPYELQFVEPHVVVRSYGPDGVRGTDDDITSLR